MYVVLYQPEGAEAEVFGPYATPNVAASGLRRIAAAAGSQLDVAYSDLLATLDVTIDGERHRYQLLKVASTAQLDVHAEIIQEEAAAGSLDTEWSETEPSPSRLSGY